MLFEALVTAAELPDASELRIWLQLKLEIHLPDAEWVPAWHVNCCRRKSLTRKPVAIGLMSTKKWNSRLFVTTSFAIVALLLFDNLAHAQISVSRSVVEFTSNSLIQDVDILNAGDFKIFLNLSVAQILNPESETPTRIELSDPRTAAVLVSPTQAVIPPGQRKRVRVILRDPPVDVDSIYRLAIKPFIGDVVLSNDNGGEKQSALKVLLGYDLLLVARPDNSQVEIDVQRTDKQIQFVNRGNTNVLLRRITQCDSSVDECVELQPKRLYAGETYKVDLPRHGSAEQYPVKVWQAIGLKNAVNQY